MDPWPAIIMDFEAAEESDENSANDDGESIRKSANNDSTALQTIATALQQLTVTPTSSPPSPPSINPLTAPSLWDGLRCITSEIEEIIQRMPESHGIMFTLKLLSLAYDKGLELDPPLLPSPAPINPSPAAEPQNHVHHIMTVLEEFLRRMPMHRIYALDLLLVTYAEEDRLELELMYKEYMESG